MAKQSLFFSACVRPALESSTWSPMEQAELGACCDARNQSMPFVASPCGCIPHCQALDGCRYIIHDAKIGACQFCSVCSSPTWVGPCHHTKSAAECTAYHVMTARERTLWRLDPTDGSFTPLGRPPPAHNLSTRRCTRRSARRSIGISQRPAGGDEALGVLLGTNSPRIPAIPARPLSQGSSVAEESAACQSSADEERLFRSLCSPVIAEMDAHLANSRA